MTNVGVDPQHGVGERLSGLAPNANVEKLLPSCAMIVMVFALALEDQNSAPATSTAAVKLNLLIFFLLSRVLGKPIDITL
jgi:hypothetical protein